MRSQILQHQSVCSHAHLRSGVCLDCGDWQIMSCHCDATIFNLGRWSTPAPRTCGFCGTAYPWTRET